MSNLITLPIDSYVHLSPNLLNSLYGATLGYTLLSVVALLYVYAKLWEPEDSGWTNLQSATGMSLFFIVVPGICITYYLLSVLTTESALVWSSQLLVTPSHVKLLKVGHGFFLVVVLVLTLTRKISLPTGGLDFVSVALTLFSLTSIFFMLTSFYGFVFLIELTTLLVLLLLVVSNFQVSPTPQYYNSERKTLLNLYLFYSITIFFWVAVLTSILLFVWLLMLSAVIWLPSFTSVDVYLTSVLQAPSSFGDCGDYYQVLFWPNFGFCVILIKLGMPPFFLWKPAVFRGFPNHVLLCYIVIYYPAILLFIMYFMHYTLNLTITLALAPLLLTLLVALVMFTPVTFDSTNVKGFFAVSSILNTFLIFVSYLLALC